MLSRESKLSNQRFVLVNGLISSFAFGIALPQIALSAWCTRGCRGFSRWTPEVAAKFSQLNKLLVQLELQVKKKLARLNALFLSQPDEIKFESGTGLFKPAN